MEEEQQQAAQKEWRRNPMVQRRLRLVLCQNHDNDQHPRSPQHQELGVHGQVHHGDPHAHCHGGLLQLLLLEK